MYFIFRELSKSLLVDEALQRQQRSHWYCRHGALYGKPTVGLKFLILFAPRSRFHPPLWPSNRFEAQRIRSSTNHQRIYRLTRSSCALNSKENEAQGHAKRREERRNRFAYFPTIQLLHVLSSPGGAEIAKRTKSLFHFSPRGH